MTVTGQGFGNTASNIKANMGSYKCDVVGTVTDTQFKCQIEATGKVHQVSNQGASASKISLDAAKWFSRSLITLGKWGLLL